MSKIIILCTPYFQYIYIYIESSYKKSKIRARGEKRGERIPCDGGHQLTVGGDGNNQAERVSREIASSDRDRDRVGLGEKTI